ncbi:MAG: DNA-processing protein DprA [Clostridia bacterium]|nr:DNA-processing protein DprA [Clostridia bacterium]
MIKYYIWLQNVLGVANNRIKEILDTFGNAKNVYNSDFNTLKNSRLFTANELKKLNDKNLKVAEDISIKCRKNNIEIIVLGNDKYPFCLSVIDNPPLVLYVKGNLPDFDKIPSIAIVGPRKVSDFGKRAAYSLGYRLAKSGMTVVSGGAIGTDTYAHAGALKSGGTTALVLGCGILYDYLMENEKLREAVSANGALISEYPPDFPASRYTFPVRNRIISALSLGTVVIEAGAKSGSLITARHAYEQGRDVFVIPRSPEEKQFSGSNELLRDGAKPLIDASDIFNEYIMRFPDKINIEKAYNDKIINNIKTENYKITKKVENNKKISLETLSKEAKIVYNCLDKQKFLPEEILGTNLSSSQLLCALGELEMELIIKALPGGYFEII